MAISLVGASAIVSGTTVITPAMPAGWQAGDLGVIVTSFGTAANTAPSAPAGWTLVASGSGGAGAFAPTSGPRRLNFFVKELAPGDTAPSISSSGGTGAVHQGRFFIFRKTEGTWEYAASTGEDLTSDLSLSAALGAALGFTGSAVAVLGAATADRDITSLTMSATGATVSATNNFLFANTVNGNDQSFGSAWVTVTGTSNVAPTVTATLAKADDGVVGALRISELVAGGPVSLGIVEETDEPIALMGRLPGLIDGITIESHTHMPPVIDSNGNLYNITESYLADGNQPMAMKSTDGGVTWVEMNRTGRPNLRDQESGWQEQVGTSIFYSMLGADFAFTEFHTSDHPTTPDQWVLVDPIPISLGAEIGSAQFMAMGRRSTGEWVFSCTDGMVGTDYRVCYFRRTGLNTYSAKTTIETTGSQTNPTLVIGKNDVAHIFYKDHTNARIYWRTLSAANVLSAATRIDTGGTLAQQTNKTEVVLTNPVYYETDTGQEVISIGFASPTSIFKVVSIIDGVVQPEETVSASAVMQDPGITANLSFIAHLAHDGTTLHAIWSRASDGNVMYNSRRHGEAWGTEQVLVDTPEANVASQWVYNNIYVNAKGKKVMGYTYDLGPHPDDDSNIWYNEYLIPEETLPSALNVPGFANTQGFDTPGLTPGAFVLDMLWNVEPAQLGQATLAGLATTISPASIPSGEAFGLVGVEPQPLTVNIGTLGQFAVLGTPTLSSAGASILPAGLGVPVSLGIVSLSPGSASVDLIGLETSLRFGGASLVPAAAILTPAGIPSGLGIGTVNPIPAAYGIGPVGLFTPVQFGVTVATPAGIIAVPVSGLNASITLGTPILIASGASFSLALRDGTPVEVVGLWTGSAIIPLEVVRPQ